MDRQSRSLMDFFKFDVLNFFRYVWEHGCNVCSVHQLVNQAPWPIATIVNSWPNSSTISSIVFEGGRLVLVCRLCRLLQMIYRFLIRECHTEGGKVNASNASFSSNFTKFWKKCKAHFPLDLDPLDLIPRSAILNRRGSV